MLKHLLLNPEKLSRLLFSLSDGKCYYVQATVNQKARRALPEEIVRQLFVLSLLHDYKYPEDRIRLEWPIQVGRERKRADIVILDEDGNVLIIIEIKVETDLHSMGQLKSYMAITGAKYGALISAYSMECIKMQSAREVHPVRDIPVFLELISTSLTDAPLLFEPAISEVTDSDTQVQERVNTTGTELQQGMVASVSQSEVLPVTELDLLMAQTPAFAFNLEEPQTIDAEPQQNTADARISPESPEESTIAELNINGNSTPDEDAIQTENKPKAIQEFPLQQLIGIEQFERKNKTHASITIKGCTLRLPIVEIDSYKILRKRFLNVGVAINPAVKQSEWFALFSHLLESNKEPERAIIANIGCVEEEVLKAINQGLPGFAGGWVSSLALDRMLKEQRMDLVMPRAKRRAMLRSLGYDHHPGLRDGRSTVSVPGTYDRPVFFIRTGHHAEGLTKGADIMRAFVEAQQPGAVNMGVVSTDGVVAQLESLA